MAVGNAVGHSAGRNRCHAVTASRTRIQNAMSRPLTPIDLNFGSGRPPHPLAWLLLSLGLTAAVGAGLVLHSAIVERDMTSGIPNSAGRPDLAAHPPPAPAFPRSARKAVAAVRRELQIPWAPLLAALEATPSHDVALIGIAPAATHRSVRITAEARNADAMLDYLAALRSGTFPHVVLTAHQVESHEAGTPIRFVARAEWGTR